MTTALQELIDSLDPRTCTVEPLHNRLVMAQKELGYVAELQTRFKESEAKCAQMREFIEHDAGILCNCNFKAGHQPSCRIVKAHDCLSNDCGKGWKSPEQYEMGYRSAAEWDLAQARIKELEAMLLAVVPTFGHAHGDSASHASVGCRYCKTQQEIRQYTEALKPKGGGE